MDYTKQFIESLDELNILSVEDDLIDDLVEAYLLGLAHAEDMLGLELTPDLASMQRAIYESIGGKTVVDRVRVHREDDNIEGLLLLKKNEYTRVYIRGVTDGGDDAVRKGVKVDKTWVTIKDNRVRDTHRYLEGVTIPMDSLFFTFDGDSAYAPHGFKDPDNNVNCRCILSLRRR